MSSRDSKRKADLEVVRQAMIMYRSELGEYPGGDFDTAVGLLDSEGYLVGSSGIGDPRGEAYVYDDSAYSLQATLESTPDQPYIIYLP